MKWIKQPDGCWFLMGLGHMLVSLKPQLDMKGFQVYGFAKREIFVSRSGETFTLHQMQLSAESWLANTRLPQLRQELLELGDRDEEDSEVRSLCS